MTYWNRQRPSTGSSGPAQVHRRGFLAGVSALTVAATAPRVNARSWDQWRPRRMSEVNGSRAELAIRSAVFELNETGALILGACDGSRSVSQITGLVTASFEVPHADAVNDVKAYLTLLARTGLIR